jgi:hypothetical protein
MLIVKVVARVIPGSVSVLAADASNTIGSSMTVSPVKGATGSETTLVFWDSVFSANTVLTAKKPPITSAVRLPRRMRILSDFMFLPSHQVEET